MSSTFFINKQSTWMPSGHYSVPIMTAIMTEMGDLPDTFAQQRTGDWELWNIYGVQALDTINYHAFLNAATRMHNRYLETDIWLADNSLFGQAGRYFNFAFVFNELVALLKEDARANSPTRPPVTFQYGPQWQLTLPALVDDLLLSHLIGYLRENEASEDKQLARRLLPIWSRSETVHFNLAMLGTPEQAWLQQCLDVLSSHYRNDTYSPVSKGATLFPVLLHTITGLQAYLKSQS